MAPIPKRKVRAAIDDLSADRHLGKPLRHELQGLWSLRVGDLRIVYDPTASLVVEIGPRATVYEDTARRR